MSVCVLLIFSVPCVVAVTVGCLFSRLEGVSNSLRDCTVCACTLRVGLWADGRRRPESESESESESSGVDLCTASTVRKHTHTF